MLRLLVLLVAFAIISFGFIFFLGGGCRAVTGAQARQAEKEFREYLGTMYPEFEVIGIAGTSMDTDGDGYVTLQARIKHGEEERTIRAECASGFWNHGCKEILPLQVPK